MLKKKNIGHDAFELVDELGQPIVSLTSGIDKEGSLRVTATVSGAMADEIIAGLRLLQVVREVARPVPGWGAPPVQSAPQAPR